MVARRSEEGRPSAVGPWRRARDGEDVYAITSFIVGLEDDRPGTAALIDAEVSTWPPVLPVIGLLTPFPATPTPSAQPAMTGRVLLDRVVGSVGDGSQ